MTEYVEGPATEAARKEHELGKQVAERIRAEYADRMKGRPTPTQEECDMAMLGAHILHHDDDGSGPDPNVKALEATRGGGYQTRQVTAASRPARAPVPSA
jgi:hypothetical protein